MKPIHAAALALLVAGFASGSADAKQYASLEDFQATVRSHLLKYDRDHDGKTNLAEFQEYRSHVKSSSADPEKLFHSVDANNDGVIDSAECDAWSARRYAKKMQAGSGE